MADTQGYSFIAGIPAEWQDFEARHRMFLERYPHLREALDTAFLRTLTRSEPIEKFVFGYGRLCCEDFSEVFLLCSNGYGVGRRAIPEGQESLHDYGLQEMWNEEVESHVEQAGFRHDGRA